MHFVDWTYQHHTIKNGKPLIGGIDVGTNLEGAAQMFGKAGCCAVNYTTIWHRRVPNLGECIRRPPRFPLVFP